ncbi:MAG: sulfotransferase domain-containing protein [Actinomycetota bacterium]|nr:sulfotransferase domain-containing protein [Actinomycetota bacterium]
MPEKYTREWTRRLRARVLSGLYVDLNRDYRNSIFLAGSGRSGTTWVSDIINYKNEYRYVFEPFHPEKVEICRHFSHKQYLRPEDRREEFLDPAQTILSGALRSRWADRFHSRFVSQRRLIKDIRANLMLGWIRANFPEMLMIFLLRHPCAVANSKIKLGWKPDINDLLSQKELVGDFLEPFEDEMCSAKTDFEGHVFSWCVENYVPLAQLKRGEVYLAFYENLSENPKDEVGRLFAFMGKDFDESIFERMKKPSLLSREGSAVLSGERLADSWRKHVTTAQLERTIEILGLFGLDAVYSEKPMPDTGGAFTLMGTSR